MFLTRQVTGNSPAAAERNVLTHGMTHGMTNVHASVQVGHRGLYSGSRPQFPYIS